MMLLTEIEGFLEETGMSATRFGSLALNDPPFVAQLRDGRDCKLSTVEKVRSFMTAHRREASSPDAEQAA